MTKIRKKTFYDTTVVFPWNISISHWNILSFLDLQFYILKRNYLGSCRKARADGANYKLAVKKNVITFSLLVFGAFNVFNILNTIWCDLMKVTIALMLEYFLWQSFVNLEYFRVFLLTFDCLSPFAMLLGGN